MPGFGPRPATRPGGRVREVDALRGVGAILVILFHYLSRYPAMFPGARHVDASFDFGYTGVVLFFALSGFSIRFSFREGGRVTDFAVARFARLYPAYWAAMAVTLTVQAIADVPVFRVPPVAVAVNVTMLQAFVRMPAVDGVYWTLAVELGFYACMAAVWRLGGLSHIERVLTAWLTLALVPAVWSGFPEPAMQVLVLRFVPFFAIGLLAARVHRGERCWRRQAPVAAYALLVVAITQETEVLPLAATTQALFVAMTAGQLRPLCRAPLLAIGAISYPLYLVHQHVGMTIMLACDAAGLSPGIAMGIAVLCVAVAAAVIHIVAERRMGDRILDSWKRRGTAGVPRRAAT